MLAASGAGPAAAQDSRCPAEGINLASIEVTEPAANATVRGPVRVAGRAMALLPLTRVELIVGGQLVDSRTFPPTEGARDFELTWAAAGATPGRVTMRIVACNGGLGVLARGERSFDVQLAAAATSTTSATATTVAPTPTTAKGSPSTTTAAGGQATTPTAAGSTSVVPAAGQVSDTLPITVPITPTTVRRLADGLQIGPTQPRPLTLTEGGSEGGPGRPIWVGLVVGVSGMLGLVLSAIFRRHHASPPPGPDSQAAADPDLVEVP